jgi:hypothetical protein
MRVSGRSAAGGQWPVVSGNAALPRPVRKGSAFPIMLELILEAPPLHCGLAAAQCGKALSFRSA